MSTKQLGKFSTEVEIPDDVKVSFKSRMLNVEGPLGKTYKNFKKIPVDIEIGDSSVLLKAQGTRNANFAIMNTARSIIRNLFEGVIEGYTIKMKVVFSHFQTSFILGDAPAFLYNSSVSVTSFWVCFLNSESSVN